MSEIIYKPLDPVCNHDFVWFESMQIHICKHCGGNRDGCRSCGQPTSGKTLFGKPICDREARHYL